MNVVTKQQPKQANAKTKQKRTYVGKAWVNVFKNDPDRHAISVAIDQDKESFTVDEEHRLVLWENGRKRKGKADPDYNVSIEPIRQQ